MKTRWNLMYYIGLIFTLFPFITTYHKPYFSVVAITTLLFIVTYLLSVWNKYVNICWIYMCLYIMSMVVFVSVGNAMFLFFQTNLLTFKFTKESYKSFKWIMLYLELVICYGVMFVTKQIETIIPSMIMHGFAIGMAILMKYNFSLEKKKEEQDSAIKLLFFENERHRIERDLHDTLGHVFAMLSVKSELALTLLENKAYDRLAKELIDIMTVTRTSMTDVRNIVHRVQYLSIDDELMILSNVLKMANIKLVVEHSEVTKVFKENQVNMVSMILRELVTNVLKHAQATICVIRFQQEAQQIIITCQDNGIGFKTLHGNELHTIQSRITVLKGTCTIVSLKNPTIITLCMPLEEEI